jgi:hypothetical protein
MTHTYVRLPTGDIEIEHIRETAAEAKSHQWECRTWFPRPALIDKKTGFASHLYTGQRFDSHYFTLADKGWTHDHCLICFQSISEAVEQTEINGYFDGNDWVCTFCFEKFIQADDLENTLSTLEKIQK